MGGKQTKRKKTTMDSMEPDMLQRDSLDLIYIDDFFDDPRYLKALEKHKRKVQLEQSRAMKKAANKTKSRLRLFEAMSDTFLMKKWISPKSSRRRFLKSKTVSRPPTPKRNLSSRSRFLKPKTVSRPATPKPNLRPSTYSIRKTTRPPPKTPAGSSKSTMSVASKNVGPSKAIVPSKSVTIFQPTSVSRPVSSKATTTSSVSNKNVGPSAYSYPPSTKIPVKSRSTAVASIPPPLDNKNQGTLSCFPSFASLFGSKPSSIMEDQDTTATKTTLETGDHSAKQGTIAALPPLSLKAKKQRSAFTTSNGSTGAGNISRNPPPHSYDDIVMRDKLKGTRRGKPRQTSVDRNWAPASAGGGGAVPEEGRPKTTVLSRSSQGQGVEEEDSTKKKKLVVRGLQHYVNTHKRSGSSSLWKREFPIKGKYHPDNYIYEHEGPRCPPRPCSAMAKCRKHGGRCDVCGIFTCDLCQRCRKCELDCCCPKAPPCPNPMNLYSEMFGDGWKKTCKVITDLTEQDKTNPVGGNANKRRQVCQKLSNQDRSYCYQPHQIDVLNPYRQNCDDSNQQPLQHQQHQFPSPYAQFCSPQMLPYVPSMSYMPIPMMPPPMPFYPAPPLPPYDPYLSPSPYPPSDSFMPYQNY